MYTIGTRVTAQWTDGNWYPGKIAQVEGKQFCIQFDDGASAWVQAHQIQVQDGGAMAKPGGGGFAFGARIKRQWTDGNWYSGTIDQVSGTDIHVKFDDGDEAWLATHEVELEAPSKGGMSKPDPGMMKGGMAKPDPGMMKGGMYSPGQKIEALWGGSWYGATVVKDAGAGQFFVKYDDGTESTLGANELRPIGGMAKPDPGMMKGGMYSPGQKIEALWGGSWYGATVVKDAGAGQFFVKYDDGTESTLGANELRPIGGMSKGGMGGMAKPGMFTPGQKVQAEWSGSWYGGKISEVGGDGRYLVTYDDGTTDWLTPDRIKP